MRCVRWTEDQLDKKEASYLANLDLKIQIDDEISLTHSTFNHPELFDYIQTAQDAQFSFAVLETTVGFIGHSHVPIVFLKNGNHSLEQNLVFDKKTPAIVNVGSVGQPRDGNPKACCAIYDSDKKHISIHRVEYDIEKAIHKINATKVLPEISGERLRHGR